MLLNGQLRFLPSALLVVALTAFSMAADQSTLVFSGYKDQKPGAIHKITVSDLPQPYRNKVCR